MATIPVEIPRELENFIESEVKNGRFASVSDYIVALVTSALRGRSTIDLALLEGLDSGPAEAWTSTEWTEMRERVTHRHRGA